MRGVAGAFEAPPSLEEAAAATPPPARSPNAALPAPPPAFTMAPALEATAAAETAKALRSFGWVLGVRLRGKKGRETVEWVSSIERRKKTFSSFSIYLP